MRLQTVLHSDVAVIDVVAVVVVAVVLVVMVVAPVPVFLVLGPTTSCHQLLSSWSE